MGSICCKAFIGSCSCHVMHHHTYWCVCYNNTPSHLGYYNEPWYYVHGLVALMHRALCPYAMHSHPIWVSHVSCCPIVPWHCAHAFMNWVFSHYRPKMISITTHTSIEATGCTPHMSCSLCVPANMSFNYHGHAMVPPWCDQGLALVPPWITYPSLEE